MEKEGFALSEFYFNAEAACRYGVGEAILLHSMRFWVEKNRAAGRHFHGGCHWTYNTQAELTARFPFWSRRQLERIVHSCRTQDALRVSRLSKNRTDRTLWYTLSPEAMALYARTGICNPSDGEVQATKPCHPSPQTGNSNKDTDTDTDTTPISPRGAARAATPLSPEVGALLARYTADKPELTGLLEELMEIRRLKQAVNSPRAVGTLLDTLERLSGGVPDLRVRLVEQSVVNSWKSVFALRGGRPTGGDAHPLGGDGAGGRVYAE